uniref:Putative secreted peptide n=1 Tax=Anopheles braziliensis TaxID=58242 RepID=A0A2M3ZTR9_9DIPT
MFYLLYKLYYLSKSIFLSPFVGSVHMSPRDLGTKHEHENRTVCVGNTECANVCVDLQNDQTIYRIIGRADESRRTGQTD